MQPKTRKFPAGNLPKIASTACVPSQARKSASPIAVATFAKMRMQAFSHGSLFAQFSKVSSKWKLEKVGLHGAYPPDPLCTPKLSNYSTGISEFLHSKSTPPDTAYYKIFFINKEGKGQSNGKKRKTK